MNYLQVVQVFSSIPPRSVFGWRQQYQHSLSPETDSYDSWFDDICKVRVERVKRFKAGNEDVADHRLLRSLRVLGLESGKDLAVLFHAMLIELIA